MKPYRNLRNIVTLLVLCVLIVSGALTGVCIGFIYYLRIIPSAIVATFWLPFFLVVVSSIIGALLAACATRIFIKPIDELAAATKAVAKGDFSVRVNESTRSSELHELLRNYNIMAKELEGIELFRSDFINNFSHEFKTPIVSIRGFAKQLVSNDLTKEEQKKYAEIIVAESERLSGMAANVLLLSKLESQQLISDRTWFSLDEQIRSCILLLQKEWEEKNLSITVDLDEISFFGNEEIMSHIWINLLSNAIKYTHEGGSISILAKKEEENICVSVADNGIGMSKETLSKAFDKFYQGDSSHAARGNGLGLSLVRRIVTLCGGSVSAESTEGEGSVFTVRLPLC